MTTQAKRTQGPWHGGSSDHLVLSPRHSLVANCVDPNDAALIVRLENAEAKVREALEAFAKQSDRLHESVPDYMALAVNGAFGKGGGELKITVGHLRKARAALALLDGEGNGNQLT